MSKSRTLNYTNGLQFTIEANTHLHAVGLRLRARDIEQEIERISGTLSNRLNYHNFVKDLFIMFNLNNKYLNNVVANERAKFVGQRLVDWYKQYNESYASKHPEQQRNKQKKPDERREPPGFPNLLRERPSRQSVFERIKFPYKTKREAFERINETDIPLEEIKPTFSDKYLLPQRKYNRPCFSPFLHSWIIDLVISDKGYYFAAINVNTKYMFMIPIRDKSTREIEKALDFIRERVVVRSLSGDGV
jgi:hypothetical protein